MSNSWCELLDLARERRDARLLEEALARSAECFAGAPPPGRGEPYGRRVLYQDPEGEVMLARWECDGRSAPHAHGRSSGLVLVLAGRFTETSYDFDGRELRVAGRRELWARELARAEHGRVHDMHARTQGLTLHFYFPAIEGMCVYDVVERATLRVSADCGAWIPERPESIHEYSRWLARANSESC